MSTNLRNKLFVSLIFQDEVDNILDSDVVGFNQILSVEEVFRTLSKFGRYENLIAQKDLFLVVRTHNCSVPGIGSGRKFVMQHSRRNLAKGATPFLCVDDIEHLLKNIVRHARPHQEYEHPKYLFGRDIRWSNFYYEYLLENNGDLIYLDSDPIEAEDGLRSIERSPHNSVCSNILDDLSTSESTTSSLPYRSNGSISGSSSHGADLDLGFDDLSLAPGTKLRASDSLLSLHVMDRSSLVDKSEKLGSDHEKLMDNKDDTRKKSVLSRQKRTDYGNISDRSVSDDEVKRIVPSDVVRDATVSYPAVQRAAEMLEPDISDEHDREVATMVAQVKKDFCIELPVTEEEALFLRDVNNHHVWSENNHSINPEFLLVYHRLSGFSLFSICRQYYRQYFNDGIETNMVDAEIIVAFKQLGPDVQEAVLSLDLVFDPLPFPVERCPYCSLYGVHEPVKCPLVISVAARDAIIKKQRKCAGCHKASCGLQRNDHSSKGVNCKRCTSTFHTVDACNADIVWTDVFVSARRARFIIATTRYLTTHQLDRIRDGFSAARQAYFEAKRRV